MSHLPQYFKFVRWMLTSSLNVLAALYCWFAFILDRFVLFAQVVYFVAAIFRRLIADKIIDFFAIGDKSFCHCPTWPLDFFSCLVWGIAIRSLTSPTVRRMRDCSDQLDFLELSPKCIGSTAKSCLSKTSVSKGKLSGKCGAT